MKAGPTNLPASIHQRLLNRAKKEDRPLNELLQYFSMERFLFRLSRSRHVERFLLKGALMLKQAQWRAFLRRSRLDSQAPGLVEVVAALQSFLMPPTLAVATGEAFEMVWPASGPWQPARKGA